MSSIVPEDFDLDAARAAQSTTEDDDQPRCPNCRHRSLRVRTGKEFGDGPRRDESDADYRCQDCGELFDNPVYGEEERDD